MFKILVVEDAEDYQKIISRTLGDYQVICSSSAEEALPLLRNKEFDLVLVDINLPQKDGYSLLAEIRSSEKNLKIPVLCLTGRKEITDKVTAFSLGADDYITKPFDPIELKIRVDAKLRSTARQKTEELTTRVGDIEIDHSRHQVIISYADDPQEIKTTQTEFKILSCLARRPNQVYTRDQLLVAAWGENAKVLDRVVDAHICSLRKKLGPYGQYVQSITGVGYKLVPFKKESNKAS